MVSRYAFFDFDNTLIKGDSILRFLPWARKQGLCTWQHQLKSALRGLLYMMVVIDAESCKAYANRFLMGKTEKELADIGRRFAEEKLIPNLYKEGVEQIKQHQKEGCKVLLVSASTDFYLRPVADFLGLDGVIATQLHINPLGEVSGRIENLNCRGVQKPLRIAEWLSARGDVVDYDNSFAYGDSQSDAHMLNLCRHKGLVNPRRGLKKAMKHADGVVLCRWGKKKDR